METPSKDQIIELLEKNIIFKGAMVFEEYGDEDLEKVIEKVHISQPRAGDVIFSQDDEGDELVLLLKGEVEVYVTEETGAELSLARLEENSFFGEMAIIDQTVRMASVRALSDCVIGSIHSDDFWGYFHRYPELSKNILRGINKRLRETDKDYIKRLAKEKDELVRFSQELEKKVKEKTGELRQKDMQVIEMDRMAGIGTLAAGIAHEINNPLGFMKSSIGSLKKGLEKMVGAVRYWDENSVSESSMKDYEDYLVSINAEHLANSLDMRFDRISRGIERIMKIVDSLRSFSRLDMEAVGEIDINQSLEDAVKILASEEMQHLEFIRDFQKVPLMKCHTDEINQCLLHVLKNAVDAVQSDGTIKLRTSCTEKEDQIVVRIIDNGKGMSPEVLKQALNPFFTTKPVGSGTGVGLSITERIVKHHGGEVRLSSIEGEGTTATIILPVDGVSDSIV